MIIRDVSVCFRNVTNMYFLSFWYPDHKKYVALFDFEPRENYDLGFQKGDILLIFDDRYLNAEF